ncbi:MAG: DNA translocase FtsK 4TM domain-containing protein, partial [Planctomycetia bacterium]|nr:DNA translocase FtsK 4TM domain-containing protein [Planctomycetia bacterium]
MHDRHRLKTDLLAIGLLAATVFVALSLFSHDPGDPPATTVYPARAEVLNTCGRAGAWVSHLLHTAFGAGAWFVLVVMAVVDVRLFSRKTEHDPFIRGFGWGLLLLTACIACRALFNFSGGAIQGSGGLAGAWGLALLQEHFSTAGTVLLVLTGLVVGMLLTTDLFLFRALGHAMAAPYFMFHWLSFGRRIVVSSPKPAEPLRIRETASDARPEITINAPASLVTTAESTTEGEETPEIDGAAAEIVVSSAGDAVRQSIRVNPPMGAAARPDSRDKLYALP